jgi:hypothetical protein
MRTPLFQLEVFKSMSSFNILITEITCPNCGEKSKARIQFKFGNTWQLEYRIRDTITWGGNDIGDPNLSKVKVYGIIESSVCPFCKRSSIPEEYDIIIEDDVIINFSPIENIQDYIDGNGEYIPLDK